MKLTWKRLYRHRFFAVSLCSQGAELGALTLRKLISRIKNHNLTARRSVVVGSYAVYQTWRGYSQTIGHNYTANCRGIVTIKLKNFNNKNYLIIINQSLFILNLFVSFSEYINIFFRIFLGFWKYRYPKNSRPQFWNCWLHQPKNCLVG